MKIILTESQFKRVILKENAEEDIKKWCNSNKDKFLDEIKQLWYDWAESDVTKKRLMDSLKTPLKFDDKPGRTLDSLEKVIGVFSPETYAEHVTNAVINAVKEYSSYNIRCGFQNEDPYLKENPTVKAYENRGRITMNLSKKDLQNEEGFKNVLMHEFTHYIDEKVHMINLLSNWENPLPLTQQGHGINYNMLNSPTIKNLLNNPSWLWGDADSPNSKFRDFSKSQDLRDIIDKNTIDDFKRNGISEEDLSYWLKFVAEKWGGLTRNKAYYDCRQKEKEANLKSIRLHYCKNITCNLSTKQFKNMMKIREGDGEYEKGVGSNIKYLIKCWASNGFQPNFREFLNGLNAIALTDDEELKTKKTTFKDIKTDNFS